MSRLGLHVQNWSPGTLDSALQAKGAILKVMAPDASPVRSVLEQKHDTILVLRKYWTDDEQRQFINDGEDGGRRCLQLTCDAFSSVISVAREFEAPVYVEGINEPPWNPWNEAPKRQNDFNIGLVEASLLRKVLPAVLSTSVGNPPGNMDERAYIWAMLTPCLFAAKSVGGAIAVHLYGAPRMNQPDPKYYALRYRDDRTFWPSSLQDLPMLVTECGIDGGVIGAAGANVAGWRSYATPEQYAADLTWFNGEITKDPYVLGATVFTAGGDFMWKNFDVTGVDVVLDAIAADTPQEELMPKPTKITPIFQPIGHPGGEAVLTLRVEGVDGYAKGFVDVAYDVLPGNEFGATYGPNMTTEVGPFTDGAVTLRVKVAENSSPIGAGVSGNYHVRIFETDGKEWDGGEFGPYPMTITPETAPEPQPANPPVQPPVPSTAPYPPEIDTAYGHVTNGYNALVAAGDTVGAEQMKKLEMHLLFKYKGEGASDPLSARKS